MEKQMKIYAYKHDGGFHRMWYSTREIVQNKDYFINYIPKGCIVVEGIKRKWHTREPAIVYFSKSHWFNIIMIIKEDEISYYCNLASPILNELGSLKYIDYDLDVKYFPKTKTIKLLDQNEFNENCVKLNYSPWIKEKVEKEREILIRWTKEEIGPFNQTFREKYLRIAKEMNESNNNK